MPSAGSGIDAFALIGFLELIDQELPRDITLVAVGGTALTLLEVKPSTRDIDFTGTKEDIRLFDQTCGSIPHGMKIDTYADGLIFQTQLPDDHLSRSRRVGPAGQFRCIVLKALDPLDVVVTKIGRLDERDEQDIRDCIRKFRLKKSDVRRRASQVEYIGVTEHFEHHLHLVLSRFFR